MFNLKITERTHLLLDKYIEPGDTAIDATLGNGNDALFLYHKVGLEGVVIGLDIQRQAIVSSRQLFQEHGVLVDQKQVRFYQLSHDKIDELDISEQPKVIIFNLGYLPSGDKKVTSQVDTSMIAIKKSLQLLIKGGVLSIVTYPGHDEGLKEQQEVLGYLKTLASKDYEVLSIYQTNRSRKTPVQHLVFKR